MTHPTHEDPTRLDDKAAAHYLGTTPATLRKSRVTGSLWGFPTPEFLKFGRRVIYERETLDVWFQTHARRCRNTGEARA
ncbi:hypothetical protein ASALC70_00030 [Alcanivorax sp. ALC70]|nr:hypothetical protein [Alcanivorax sp.]MBI56703.1 hypothetical protein [Alcanivorax sp.]UWN47857.1 hypothetical protein ASALC70_00030 [Alcanivorax sp. ALC70]|tara:strand:+ start:1042 stop:1278 length:237 start_codon:yes stop_codon:yes gene_type:complete